MLRFEWDKEKDEINRRKHRIGFDTAKLAFDDPNCLTFVERVGMARNVGTRLGFSMEERWLPWCTLIGQKPVEIVRIVSARRADAQERKLYAEGLCKPT